MADTLKKEIIDASGEARVLTSELGCALAAHLGKNLVGVCVSDYRRIKTFFFLTFCDKLRYKFEKREEIVMAEQYIKAALLGFGTVGSGVYKVMKKQEAEMEAKLGAKVRIEKILVRNWKKLRKRWKILLY